MIARLIARLFAPFVVRCATVSRAVHYAHTPAEAFDWMRQYPPGFGPVSIENRRTGRVVARRITVE